jgi:7-keto-8-aminopelargonate synthetase-like enzyme
MDGDIAPLPQILELAKRYDAITFVDECHATGVFGDHGKGIEEYFGCEG